MNSVAGQQNLITLLPRLLYAVCCRKNSVSSRQSCPAGRSVEKRTEVKLETE